MVRLPFPAAGRSPIVEKDIGAVAARTLLDGGHVGVKHVLSGPEQLTEGDLVRIIADAIDRPIRVEETDPEVARAEHIEADNAPDLADAALVLWASLVTEPERVTLTAERLTRKALGDLPVVGVRASCRIPLRRFRSPPRRAAHSEIRRSGWVRGESRTPTPFRAPVG